MIIMIQGIIYTIMLGLGILLLFGVAELLYHKFKVKAEITRKFVHFSGGLSSLFFPYFFDSHLYVLALCNLFAAISFLSIRFGILPSINAIDRISKGSILYPFAVYGCYLAYYLTGHNLKNFYIPILILAVCDAIAALAGKTWPVGKFHIGNHTKTLTGSLAFFCCAFTLSILLLNSIKADTYERLDTLFLAAIIATTTTWVEAVSTHGYDNLTIPGSTLLILLFVEKFI